MVFGRRRLAVHASAAPLPPAVEGALAAWQVRADIVAALIACLLLLPASANAAPACPDRGKNFPSLYTDAALFRGAIARADTTVPPTAERVTGIAVPHHLLVAHLTAEGSRAASGFQPKRIFVLAPDHFRRADRPFAVATHGFDTVLGPVAVDEAVAEALAHAPGAEASCLFAKEHGVQAVLPFVRHYFPGVPIVAVAVATRSNRADWDAFADALAPFVGNDTLVIQSTDFSHYLPAYEARRFDQQVLNVLASGSLDALAKLRQPQHTDSVGAFYIQAKLQARLGSVPIVSVNENSQKYAENFAASTTSYLVIQWARFTPQSKIARPEAKVVFLAGDTFFGRAMQKMLADEQAGERIAKAVLGLTHGLPLVVNLEGVILPNVPEGLRDKTLAMPAELAIPWLEKLHVAGVGLANNHAMDLGSSGLAETRAALARAGIPAAAQGEVLQLPGLDIVALSDLDNAATPSAGRLTPALLDRLVREGGTQAVVAFVHWGREWIMAPALRETALAEEMTRRGAAVVAGAHPHAASRGLAVLAGGDTLLAFSLGNFLFDQGAERGASGSLLELTVFPQGTVFGRLLPLPNLFDLGR